MLRTILTYGVLAGLVVTVPMNLMLALYPSGHMTTSLITGYALMLLALTFVFFGVRRHRDKVLGGVIKFLPALGIGLGISVVAGIMYVIGWEISLAVTNYTFINDYTASMIAAERAKGVSGPELDAFITQMDQMKAQYANPLFRLPMTFVEIFPVGVLVSLISAALLRFSRFLPARRPAAA